MVHKYVLLYRCDLKAIIWIVVSYCLEYKSILVIGLTTTRCFVTMTYYDNDVTDRGWGVLRLPPRTVAANGRVQGAALKMTQHQKCAYSVTPENFCTKFCTLVRPLMCWFSRKLLYICEIGIIPNFKFEFCNCTSLLLRDVTFHRIIFKFTGKKLQVEHHTRQHSYRKDHAMRRIYGCT